MANVPDINLSDGTVLGHRHCPDDKCLTHVFFAHRGGVVVVSYPTEKLDFDATNLPAGVRAALEEAITCHAYECYTAAAIMVRKTLEELCQDQGAKGPDLKSRLVALKGKALLPEELIAGLDHLRLLGNDAAHIESKTYADIGKEEVEVAVLVAKEVLKAVYQYSALVDRLQKLQKNRT